jgi:glycosyltransferase involved in cell wall biosynthesis
MKENNNIKNQKKGSHTSDPLISVIIPTYNRAAFIKRSVNSVVKQSYKNIEIIVVDDGSTDNTENLIKNVRDKRIKYIKHTENKGVSHARNTGIKIARGEYISFLDSDDEIYPKKIETQYKKLHVLPNTYGLIYCGHRIFINSTNEYVEDFLGQKYDNIKEILLKRCLFAVHAPLIRKMCFEKCGLFDESLVECEDWDMWIRLSQHYKFTVIPDALVKFYIHEGQKSTHLKNKIEARENILLKHKKLLEERKLVYSWHLRRIGSLYSLDGNAAAGRRYLLKSILANPANLGSYLHLILSVLSRNMHQKIIMKYGVQTIGNVRLTF